ncbi:MAG TPA: VCBS repeat-containing protein [Candidatus Binatia bacterium]|nr:VCBS repeat-containing protein [Candidatus Binatia bacterium]
MSRHAILAILCLVLACGMMNAQPLFPNPVYPVGADPTDMVKADFTGDGIPDLLVSNLEQALPSGDLSLLAGRGDGTFAEEVRIPVIMHPFNIDTADFNGDGKADLLLGDYGAAWTMAGNGNGTFGAAIPLTAAGVISYAQVADFNDDAAPDILVSGRRSTGDFVQALLGNGQGSFTTGPFIVTWPLGGSAPADVNGDGRDDILVLNDKFQSCDGPNPPAKQVNDIQIYLGRGNGVFDPAGTISTGEWIQSFQAVDLDRDGHLDLVLGVTFFQGCSGNSGGRATWYGNGNGTFVSAPVELDRSGTIVPAELNGDGILDYVETLYGVTPFIYEGGRNWTEGEILWFSGDPNVTIPDDYNGDGLTDLALFSGRSQAVYVINGNGNGTFGPPVLPTLRFAGTTNAATGDFNNDGALDVAATGGDTGDVGVALGNGNGTFGAETRYPVGDGAFTMTIADLDNDGNRDIVAALFNWHTYPPDVYPDGSLSILLGQGDGTFGPPTVYESGQNPLAMAVADFDENGAPDVVLANWGDGYDVYGDLSLYLGRGDGTVDPQVRLAVDVRFDPSYGPTFPVTLGVGDFDEDGHRDLVVGMRGNYFGGQAGDVQILFGNGDGTFQAPSVVTLTGDTESVAIADLNHDGHQDIAVADMGGQVSYAPGGVRVLLGDGSGGFTGSPLLPAGIGPYDVKIDDYNADGIPDLALSTNGGYLVLLTGLGDGTFGARLNFGLVGLPLAFVKGDFDGDGQPDLLVLAANGAYLMRNAAVPPPLSIDVSFTNSSPLSKGSGTVFWTTDAERDLVGFNIVVKDHARRTLLNNVPIRCEECSTGSSHTYAYYVPKHKSGRDLYIEAIHRDGRIETFGPARRN